MTYDINSVLFTRTSPSKKMDIVQDLTLSELLAITPATVTRIIKEVGRKIGKTRRKELYISRDIRTGNDWDSEFEGVEFNKGKLYVALYLQYSNTDITIFESYDKFFRKGDYRGSFEWQDRYGGTQTSYFTYSESTKARCIRRLLMQYLHLKYKDKLVKSEAA